MMETVLGILGGSGWVHFAVKSPKTSSILDYVNNIIL